MLTSHGGRPYASPSSAVKAGLNFLADASPFTFLEGNEVVGARGFEPRTSCAQGRRATRLRYAPTCTPL